MKEMMIMRMNLTKPINILDYIINMKHIWNIIGTIMLLWLIWRLFETDNNNENTNISRIKKKKAKKTKNSDTNTITIQSEYLSLLSDKYASEEFQSPEYKNDIIDYSGGKITLPTGRELIDLIKTEYLDDDYKFNVSSQPVTTVSGIKTKKAKKLVKKIGKMIDDWNGLFSKYYQNSNKLLHISNISMPFAKETCNEFFSDIYVQIVYLNANLNLHLNVYGSIEKTGDFFTGKIDEYLVQLVMIKPISEAEYKDKIGDIEIKPFITNAEALEYVDKMNKVRKTEETDFDPTKCRKYIGDDNEFCYYGDK
jgi:hypothetical protein